MARITKLLWVSEGKPNNPQVYEGYGMNSAIESHGYDPKPIDLAVGKVKRM